MIQITPHMRILVAVQPVDFRKGIDGLAALCRQGLGSDPLSGILFVFCSRRRHAIKCLTYDGQGFWLCQKRLSSGRFSGLPKADGPCSVRRGLMLALHRAGHIELPAKRSSPINNAIAHRRVSEIDPCDCIPIEGSLASLGPLEIRLVRRAEGETLFAHLLSRYHYLGYSR